MLRPTGKDQPQPFDHMTTDQQLVAIAALVAPDEYEDISLLTLTGPHRRKVVEPRWHLIFESMLIHPASETKITDLVFLDPNEIDRVDFSPKGSGKGCEITPIIGQHGNALGIRLSSTDYQKDVWFERYNGDIKPIVIGNSHLVNASPLEEVVRGENLGGHMIDFVYIPSPYVYQGYMILRPQDNLLGIQTVAGATGIAVPKSTALS